uniref:(S)-N-methylcoclaurine 3'-hydroxylase isozyme 1-like n=1 Tax=Erigeron canadensis TaxID=72917 RepID=UPI001CB8FBDD|nr:(S)-N-methylcoclaurine 3'-hydroxylase isozyme 1-like [Erigeron canadensis]
MSQLNNYGSWWWEMTSSNYNTEFTLAVVTISVVILTISLWYKMTTTVSSSSSPPGPRSLPIVGYLPFLGPELHKQFVEMADTFGPIFKFHLGSKVNIVINSPELAKEVVRDQDDTFANRQQTVAVSIYSYGGQDIVFSDNNSSWRSLRKILVQEILNNKNLEACRSLRRNEVRKTIKNIFGKIGTSVNINEIAFSTEAKVVSSMVWDNTTTSSAGSQVGDELRMIVSDIAETIGLPNLSDIFPCLARFDLQGVERDMQKHLNKLRQVLTAIIQDRIESNSKLAAQNGVAGRDGKKDFLQILLDLKDQKHPSALDITKIKALLVDIMTAGTETTTTLIEWAMAEIMCNEKVMKRVQGELEEMVGENNIVEESHLPKLQYLDATIKETFRLHPVVPLLLPRKPSQDCVVGGYTIPKGCTIFLNVWSINRDPRYWNNPLEFNPDRFLKNKWDYNGNNLKFFPFGSGRRICPGIPLAERMQMFVFASLLHSFNWSLPKGETHDLSEKFGITLKKRKPLIAIPSQRLADAGLYN